MYYTEYTLRRGGVNSRKKSRKESAEKVTQAKMSNIGKMGKEPSYDPVVKAKKVVKKVVKKTTDEEKQVTCVRKTLNWAAPKPYHLFDNSNKSDKKTKKGEVVHKKFNLEKLKEDIPTYSPKLEALLNKIKTLDADDKKRFGKQFKHFIFTDLKGAGVGAKIIASGLMTIGINSCLVPKVKKGPKYVRPPKGGADYFAMLNSSPLWGDNLKEGKRKKYDGGKWHMRDDFNGRVEQDGSINNIHGEYIRFMIVDSGYKEGIDLFDIKYVHLFEPQLTEADETQAVGRATRKCGQKGLKFIPNKGWKLEVYEYTSSFMGRSLEGLYHDVLKTDLTNMALGESLAAISIGTAVDREFNSNLNPPYGKLRPGRKEKYSERVSNSIISWKKDSEDAKKIKEFKRKNIDKKLAQRIKDFNDETRKNLIVDINRYGKMKQHVSKMIAANRIQRAQREKNLTKKRESAAAKIRGMFKSLLKKRGGAPKNIKESFDCAKLPKKEATMIKNAGKRANKTIPFSVNELSKAWMSIKGRDNPRFERNLKNKKTAEEKRKYFARILFHDKEFCKVLEKLAGKKSPKDVVKVDKDGDVVMVDVPYVKQVKEVNLDGADKVVINLGIDVKNGKSFKSRIDEIAPLLNALLENKKAQIDGENKQLVNELIKADAVLNNEGNIELKSNKIKKNSMIKDIIEGENVDVIRSENNFRPLDGEDYKTFQKRMNTAFKASKFNWEKKRLINTCEQGYGSFNFSPTQEFLQTYFEPKGVKGMLAWHTVGTGKTCAAVATKSKTWERDGYTIVYCTRTKLKEDVKKNMFGPGDPICDNIIRDNIKAHRPKYIAKLNKVLENDPTNETAKKELKEIADIEKSGASAMTTKERNMSSLQKGSNTLTAISFKTLSNVCRNCISLDKTNGKDEDFYKKFASIGKDLLEINCGVDRNQIKGDLRGPNVKPTTCDPLRKTFIIIDEAHKLFDPTLSAAEKASYEDILGAVRRSYRLSGKDSCRLLLMTATPILNNPMDYVKLLNLTFTDSDKFPDTLDEFTAKYPLDKNFAFTQTAQIALQNKLNGRISYLDRGWDATEFSQPHFYQINTEISANLNNMDKDDLDKLISECDNDDIHHHDPEINQKEQEHIALCQEENIKILEKIKEYEEKVTLLEKLPSGNKDEIKAAKALIAAHRKEIKALYKDHKKINKGTTGCGETYMKAKRKTCKKGAKLLYKTLKKGDQNVSQLGRITSKKACDIKYENFVKKP